MMETDLCQIVMESLAVPCEQVSDDLALGGIESWDSLRHMQLITAIERAYGLTLTFDEIILMTSVGAIRQVLAARGIGA